MPSNTTPSTCPVCGLIRCADQGVCDGVIFSWKKQAERQKARAAEAERERDKALQWKKLVCPLLQEISDALGIARSEESPGLQCGFTDGVEHLKKERDQARAEMELLRGLLKKARAYIPVDWGRATELRNQIDAALTRGDQRTTDQQETQLEKEQAPIPEKDALRADIKKLADLGDRLAADLRNYLRLLRKR